MQTRVNNNVYMTLIFVYISVRIIAAALYFIWAEIGGPINCFAYRNIQQRYIVHGLEAKKFRLSNHRIVYNRDREGFNKEI